MFTPGQHVIFVGASSYHTRAEDGRTDGACDLTEGAVYTVAEAHAPGFHPWPGVMVTTCCIGVAERPYILYSASLFRPISKTSADIVESLKAPSPAPPIRVREDA